MERVRQCVERKGIQQEQRIAVLEASTKKLPKIPNPEPLNGTTCKLEDFWHRLSWKLQIILCTTTKASKNDYYLVYCEGGLSHGQNRVAVKKRDTMLREELVKKLEKAFELPTLRRKLRPSSWTDSKEVGHLRSTSKPIRKSHCKLASRESSKKDRFLTN